MHKQKKAQDNEKNGKEVFCFTCGPGGKRFMVGGGFRVGFKQDIGGLLEQLEKGINMVEEQAQHKG